MLRKIIFFIPIILLLNFSNAIADWQKGYGQNKHTGNLTKEESCKIAELKAFRDGAQKETGRVMSFESTQICSEVEGELDCEIHQTQVSLINYDYAEVKRPVKENYYIEKQGDENIFYCEVEIEANYKKHSQTSDPNFDFSFKLNNESFRSGEKIHIEIIPSNMKMFMSIFQYFPYVKNDYQIQKIFPWPCEIDNEIGPEKIILPGKCQANATVTIGDSEEIKFKKGAKLEYVLKFPEEIKGKRADEFLILVASKKKINWLYNYVTYDDLRIALYKEKELIRKTKTYTISRN